MEALYDLPNGDQVRVIDTATVGQALGRVLEHFRTGDQEPVFFGDQPRPEGVVISFDQWSKYEALKEEADADARQDELVRDRLNNAGPEDYVDYNEMRRRWATKDQGDGGDETR
jgi:hypothetical protein